jgi:urease accessory protein
LTLELTAEERTRSRHRFTLPDGTVVFLRLARGTVLDDGYVLTDESQCNFMKIFAKPESVLTVVADTALLLRAAYHLVNRHVPVEITQNYLRLSPDPILPTSFVKLGLEILEIKEGVVPFQPELGAYGTHQAH